MKSNLEQRLENLRIANEESKRLTRESIQTALIDLMGKTDFDKITITELVKKSGVSRAAFYRNYKNKEEVLKDFSSNIVSIIASTLNDEVLKNNLYDWFRMYYTELKQNKKVIALVIKSNINIYDYMIRSSNIVIKKYTKEEEYKLSALIAGLIALSIKWYNNEFKETIEEMATITYDLFKELQPVL